MFTAILTKYYEDIYKAFIRKITRIEIMLYVFIGVEAISILISASINCHRAEIIALGSFVATIIGTGVYLNKITEKQKSDTIEMKRDRINKLKEMLKEDTVAMGNAEHIRVLITQAKEFEAEKNDFSQFENFKNFFFMIIYPILTSITAIIIKDMSDVDIITLAIVGIGFIFCVYAIVALLTPQLQRYLNKYHDAAKIMRRDLEIILADMGE